MVRVKDIMVKPLKVDINDNIKKVGIMMKETRRDVVIVTKSNNPVGLITDSDLVKKIIATGIKSSSVKAKDIMSKPLVAIGPNEDMFEAARKIKKSRIKRLPVMTKGRVIGIISLSDIARVSPDMIKLLEYKLKMREYPTIIKERFTSGICDSCGNYYSDLKHADDKWLCETCREEME
ncbi:MAG: CBS domain-containing protein [Candidatus Aenigmatarchaeota archaeon]